MSTSQVVKTQDKREVKAQDKQETQARTKPEAYLRPAVDIYEDGGGITLKADLPGVSRDRLDIQLDGNSLVIEGDTAIDMPKGMEPLYADVKTIRYRRQFTLSNELAMDKIEAGMKDGVLTLRLPKRAELQPRKIEISAS